MLPGASSAVRQYIETIPTAGGSQATGTGGGKTTIPTAVARRIAEQAGESAPLLERVVSSEAYGAPPQFEAATGTQTRSSGPKRRHSGTPATTQTTPRPPAPAAPAALPPAPGAVSALAGTASAEGVVFLGALVLALCVGLLPRLRRQRD